MRVINNTFWRLEPKRDGDITAVSGTAFLTSPTELIKRIKRGDGLVLSRWNPETREGEVHALGVVDEVKGDQAKVTWRSVRFSLRPSGHGAAQWITRNFFKFDALVANRYKLMSHFQTAFATDPKPTVPLPPVVSAESARSTRSHLTTSSDPRTSASVDQGLDGAIYRKVSYILQHGRRTTTYKLATMSAIIDFVASRRPSGSTTTLAVPLAELAYRVTALYWDQLRPFDGAVLKQSAHTQSRIFDALYSLRSAANCPDDDQTFATASKLAPRVFRSTLDEVTVSLAQQALPRLQRVAGVPNSDPFLYDDSFLHDKITRTELERHQNAIRLKPGVPEALIRKAESLYRLLHSTWVDDVIRINRLPIHQRSRVEDHLFGHSPDPRDKEQVTAQTGRHRDDAQASLAPAVHPDFIEVFATRLNKLISSRPKYSSGEVAAEIRRSGFLITVSTLTRLQAGIGPPPSEATIEALAKFFGVRPTYFLDGSTRGAGTRAKVTPPDPRGPERASAPDEQLIKPAQGGPGHTASDPDVGESANPPSPAHEVFTRQLNKLFQDCTRAEGGPYTSRSVAAALQDEGFTISEAGIDGLRSGTGRPPSLQTVEMLAYFFGVDPDYFCREIDAEVQDSTGSSGMADQVAEPRPDLVTLTDQGEVDISTAEVGRLITALSETVAVYITRNPPDRRSAERSLSLINALAERVSAASGCTSIATSLLQRVTTESPPRASGERTQTAIPDPRGPLRDPSSP